MSGDMLLAFRFVLMNNILFIYFVAKVLQLLKQNNSCTLQNLNPNEAMLIRGREDKRISGANLAPHDTVEWTPTVLNTFHKPDWRRLAVDVAVLRPSWAREPVCDSYLMQPGVEHGLVQGRLDRPLEDACRRRHDRFLALLHAR